MICLTNNINLSWIVYIYNCYSFKRYTNKIHSNICCTVVKNIVYFILIADRGIYKYKHVLKYKSQIESSLFFCNLAAFLMPMLFFGGKVNKLCFLIGTCEKCSLLWFGIFICKGRIRKKISLLSSCWGHFSKISFTGYIRGSDHVTTYSIYLSLDTDFCIHFSSFTLSCDEIRSYRLVKKNTV